MANVETTYWAAKPALECAKEVYKHIDNYYAWLRITGTYNLWLRSIREYYSGHVMGGQTGTAGESDETITIKENHLHNIGENIVVMTTGARPSFEPKAKNSDHASMSQVIIATGLLDNAHREKDLEGVGITVVRYAGCLFGEGYSTATWDTAAGQDYARNPDSGQVEKTGDIKLKAYLPIDVARDHTKTDSEGHRWYAVRDWVNRYELIAKRPELRDQILSLPSRFEEAMKRFTLTRDWKGVMNVDTDDVAVWTFYHENTSAVDGGRMLTLASETCILFDGPLSYEEVPVYRMVPEDMAGTQLGYWTLVDLLALQKAVNDIDSTIVSAVSNIGYGNIWTKTGNNVTVDALAGGLKHIKSNDKPEPLNLLEIPAIVPDFKNQKIAAMETISGVNSARRGTLVNDKQMSGAALALLDSKAIEFSKGLERGYVKWLERKATAIIRLYKRYAKVPQVAMVAGKANRSYMKEFTGADLDRIERVTVDLGNPLGRTTSGRLSIAQMLIGMVNAKTGESIIKTPEQVIQLLNTGRLEPVIEGSTAELMNIKAENERLAEGTPCVAVMTDNPILHLKEHMVVLASPEARENEQVVQATLGHVQEHITIWQTTDPNLLAALGIPPPPMPAPAPMATPPPVPGEAGATPPPVPGEASASVPPPEGMAPSEAGMMPRMPMNPGTGQRAPMPMPAGG